DECHHFNGDSDTLRDLDDRTDIIDMGPGCARRPNAQPVVPNRRRQPHTVLDRARARSGQANIDIIYADITQEPDDFDLVFYGRVVDRGRLDSIAQGLIKERERTGGEWRPLLDRVPVK